MTEIPPGISPVERLGPGSRIREWQVVRRIARGSFGTVFEARRDSWVEGGAPVALKVFDPILSSAARSNLVDEFMVLRTVRHPNLISGYDAFDLVDGELGGCVVFVMDLAEGDLADLLARTGPLDTFQVADIGSQVAEGLAALHESELIHGDVKPDNILRVGDSWKLGDFGVAAPLEGSYAMPVASTLDFRPPEVSGAEAHGVHRSADVWALGVTLWIAAAVEHPFVGVDPQMRHAAALRGDRRHPGRIAPDLAGLLDSACLDPNPRNRLDAAELARRLSQLSTGNRGGSPAVATDSPDTHPPSAGPPRTSPPPPVNPPQPVNPPPAIPTPAGPPDAGAAVSDDETPTVGAIDFASIAAGLLAGVLLSFLASWAVTPLPIGLWPRRAGYAVLCVAVLIGAERSLRAAPSTKLNRPAAMVSAAVAVVVSTLVLFGVL